MLGHNFQKETGSWPQNKKMTSAFLRALLLIIFLGFFSAALFGQNATFTGRVTDQSGAIVPKAQIIVHNQDTGAEVIATTTGTGDYTVPYLKPGVYSVSAAASGFKKETRVAIGLQTAQVAVIDFKLSVGTVTQSVIVNSSGALLDRGNGGTGEEVENTRVTELPLNGRNPVMLDRLNAAVDWNANLIWQRPFDGTIWTNLDINGSGSYNTEIMTDGQPDQTPRPQNGGHTNGGYVAPDDATQELKIVTNPYDAEYGQTRGGVINLTLKSGTNAIHGDAYEYMRRTWLDANTWVDDAQKVLNPTNRALYATPQHKLDQYGFELDGPVVLPKLYNGRDKLFFVTQFENYNEVIPSASTPIFSVPLPQWANGDFSGLTYNGNPVTIYNPYSTYSCTVNGKTQTCRNPFPNNQIPANMINPTAQKLLSYYPKPNQAGNVGTPWQSNYYTQEPTVDKYRNALIKLDWTPTQNDRFSLRYGYWERYETDISNGVYGPAAYGEQPLGDIAHTVGTNWTHTFTPRLVFDLRANLDLKTEVAGVAVQGFNAGSLGWPTSLGVAGTFNLFPGSNPSGFATLGDTGAGNGTTRTDALNLFPSVTWSKGKHTLHAGVDWRFGQYAIVENASTDGSLSFNQQWTQNCWSCGAGSDYSGSETNEGNSIASMLLGSGSGGSMGIGSTAFYSTQYFAPYVQDDWRISPKLTLNLGLRYDLQPYYVERHNRADYAFDTTTLNPVDAMLPFHTLATGQSFVDKGGITFLGVNGNSRQAYSTNKWEIQPRFGFAYAATDKIVVRGGFGEMFQQSDAFPILNGFSSTTNYVNSPDGGLTPIDNLSNPFPSGAVQPTGSSLGLLTNMGNAQSFINPNFQIPNVWQFSFGVEQQFSRNDIMELSYVGNRAPHNEASQNINHWNGTLEAACNVQMGGRHEVCDNTLATDPTATLGYVPNPFYHVAAFTGSTPYSQTTRQALNWTEPMPEFAGVTENQWNGARSWFNSLQLTYQHKWSNQLTLHGTWAWSKLMNAGSWADNNYLIPSRTLDPNLDRTHNITISVVWNLPVGRGRQLLGNLNRVVDTVVGGWEFASNAFMSSGTPWTVPGGWDYVGNAKIKPHWTSNGNLQWYAPCYWNTNAETGAITESAEAISYGCSQPDFIQIPSYGATPNVVYTGIREAWNILDDSNLSKNFSITERTKLQLRLETFNTFNHPLFSGGTYNGINQYAGQIGATTGGGQSNKPRYTQLAVKVSW
jgi:hypothetical protein